MKPSRLLVFAFLLEAALMPGQNMTNKTGSEPGTSHTDFALRATQYKKLLEKDSANADLNYQLGYCYLRSRSQKKHSLPYLQKAFASGRTDAAMHKLLGDSWFAAEDFDQAATHYQLCRQKLSSSAPFYELSAIDHRIELCKMGQEIKELKKALSEVASIQNSNTGSQADALNNGNGTVPSLNVIKASVKKDQDLFSDEEIIEPAKVQYLVPDTIVKREATVATSFDGQIVLLYRNDDGKGNLYLSMLQGNDWTVPDQVNRMVNVTGWEENEYISPDGNTLYFTSERAGGYGGKDIYKCTKTASGDWSRAVNLGATINTAFDEVAPCILPDGVTLYFSSNRNKSKSNFDIYMTTYADSGKWRVPLSVGYPAKKETSVRQSSHERAPEKDNYLVTFNATKALPITLLRGKLSDEKDKFPLAAEITITDNVTGAICGIYHPDENSGHYNLLLPPGKNNNVTFDATGYLFHSENIDLTSEPSLYKVVTPTVMKPFMENSSEILNNVFFASNNSTFQPASLPELQKLHLFLANNPGCRIELGCAGVSNDDSETGRLASERARAVAGYLLEQGIEKDRITTHAYVTKKKHRKKRKSVISTLNTEKIEIKITDIK